MSLPIYKRSILINIIVILQAITYFKDPTMRFQHATLYLYGLRLYYKLIDQLNETAGFNYFIDKSAHANAPK